MRRGFTAIEVLVVLCIIGIIAALTIPFFWPRHIPDHGIVVRKSFHAAHNTYVSMHNGGRGGGTHLVPIYVPDKYGVTIQEDGTTGDEGQFYVEIDKERYDKLEVGGVWTRVELTAEKQ